MFGYNTLELQILLMTLENIYKWTIIMVRQ